MTPVRSKVPFVGRRTSASRSVRRSDYILSLFRRWIFDDRRQEDERKRREEELRRLRALKRQELETKLKEIQSISGRRWSER